MRVLVACEFSGVVRRAFRALGHEAYSLDLLPADDASPFHIQEDAVSYLGRIGFRYDLMIAHPPCTDLASSGAHLFAKKARQQAEALDFVQFLMRAPVDRIAIENPIGVISTKIRKPDQIIQPYSFGENASKSTCLWLKNLPCLVPTKYVPPRLVSVGGKAMRRWGNQTDSGQNKLGPSKDRWKERSRTYDGIAEAMASQWGAV